VRDGRIVDITPASEALTSLYPRATVIDARDRIAFPGFVNSHNHGEGVLLHFLTDTTPFGHWQSLIALRDALSAFVQSDSDQLVRTAYETAATSHVMHGTTSVGEYPLAYAPATLEAVIEASSNAGLECVLALQNWDQVEFARTHWAEKSNLAIALGSEESYTVYSFEGVVRASREMHLPIVAHIGEQRKDIELLRRNFRKSPIRVLREYGLLQNDTVLLHGNYLGHDDLAVVRDSGATLSLCAGSAARKHTGSPIFRHLATEDIRVCLGTDWGASNILSEMRFLRRAPALVPGSPQFSALELMRMATINGAYALGIAQHTGSLEIGKKANLVLMPRTGVNLPPLRANPTAEEIATAIVDYCDAGMISDVMSEGVFRVRNGVASGLDVERIGLEFRRLQERFLPEWFTQKRVDAKGVSFVSAERNGGGTIGPSPPKEEHVEPGDSRRAINLSHPNAQPPDAHQKAPEAPKKIKKVFGEDDF